MVNPELPQDRDHRGGLSLVGNDSCGSPHRCYTGDFNIMRSGTEQIETPSDGSPRLASRVDWWPRWKSDVGQLRPVCCHSDL